MPHGRLRGAQGNARPAELGAEGVAQCVHIHHPSHVIALGDARDREVTVEHLAQLFRERKQRVAGAGFGSALVEYRQVVAQRLHQVVAQGDFRLPAILGVLRPKHKVGGRLVQPYLSHHDGLQLAQPHTGLDQGAVDEGALPAGLLQLGEEARLFGQDGATTLVCRLKGVIAQ